MSTRFNPGFAVSMAVAFLLLIGTVAFADSSASAVQHRHHHWKGMKKVLAACAQVNGITFPAKGSGEHLSSAERSDLHACVQEFRQDFRACVQNAGISKPEPGQKPSAADIAAFKQCRAEALQQITSSTSQ